jgi:hypothetical protein
MHRVRLLIAIALCWACAPGPGAPATHEPTRVNAASGYGYHPITPPPGARWRCSPTYPDDGPTYRPGAPARSLSGRGGHVVSGTVRSARDCGPIAGAMLEAWPATRDREDHPDELRATLFTDGAGRYRFETEPPEHIHFRISAPGFVPIFSNAYHELGGRTGEGVFDVVLAPELD